MSEARARERTRSGMGFGLLAYFLWGAMPVYFLAMAPAGAFEIVGWRIVFSVVFCALLLTVTRTWGSFRAVLRDRRTVLTFALAGALIYVNWTVYVLATVSGRVVDAALGYFINPIVTVLLGVLVLKERLRIGQWIAVGISALAVVVLGVEAGALPWISLALAASFGLYGLVKKQVGNSAGVVTGLTLETAWLAPVAAIQLLVVGLGPGLAFGSAGAFPTLMMASAGVGTAVPLLLFGSAAKRLPLTVAGFLQYLAPILQFLIGVLVLHEAMPIGRLAGFVLVWIALLMLVGESLLVLRRTRRVPGVLSSPLPEG
ncbi:MAG TPA: EamA family transporter RarD [Amnibacterium sp.]|nr:EamA family transporter RarD [Amnibacterium sp.]